MVSGIASALRASIIAWSNAICRRPSRMPVSITRKRRSMDLLSLDDPKLAPDLPEVGAAGRKRIARDVARRRIAVRPVARGNVVGELARASRRAKRDAGVDDGVELRGRNSEVGDPAVAVELHPIDAH